MTTVAEDEKANSDLIDIDAEVSKEIQKLRESGALELIPEPRCWICQDEPTRRIVNHLLARGLTFRDVVEVLDQSINPIRLQRGQRPITTRRIKTHSRNHFDLEHPSWQVYRRIMERRAGQAGKDYEQGIGGAVTHLALLETVVQKSYEHLVSPFAVVGVRDGMMAAKELAEIERKSAGQQEHAAMRAEMHRIISAVKEIVPADSFEKFLDLLKPDDDRSLPVIEGKVYDDDDDDFDPGDDEDFDHDQE